jgi:hypothetical protein
MQDPSPTQTRVNPTNVLTLLLGAALALLLALLLQQGAAADDEVALLLRHLGDDAQQFLVDVALRVLDAEQFDLADRHEAADAVDVDFEAALVGGGDTGVDDHAEGDARPVDDLGCPLAVEDQPGYGEAVARGLAQGERRVVHRPERGARDDQQRQAEPLRHVGAGRAFAEHHVLVMRDQHFSPAPLDGYAMLP